MFSFSLFSVLTFKNIILFLKFICIIRNAFLVQFVINPNLSSVWVDQEPSQAKVIRIVNTEKDNVRKIQIY